MYAEKRKTLMRQIKDDLNKWSDTAYSCIGRLDIVPSVFPQLIYRVAQSVKILAGFFILEICKVILKYILKQMIKNRIARTISKKKKRKSFMFQLTRFQVF